jgi:hypothetical protein
MPEENINIHAYVSKLCTVFRIHLIRIKISLGLSESGSSHASDADPGFLRQKFLKLNLHLTEISGSVDLIESGSNPDPKQKCAVLNSTFYTLKPKKK